LLEGEFKAGNHIKVSERNSFEAKSNENLTVETGKNKHSVIQLSILIWNGNPKYTLHELTEKSTHVDRVYGEGNLDLAREFAELWDEKVRLNEIESQCPQQFPPFCSDTTQAFRRAKSGRGRLGQIEFDQI
jgi:hypothetical protein